MALCHDPLSCKQPVQRVNYPVFCCLNCTKTIHPTPIIFFFITIWKYRGRVDAGVRGGHVSPAVLFYQAKKIKNTVNWKINKKHEIVIRSHHSTYSGSRENDRTLIYRGKNHSSLTAYSKQTNSLCPSQQQALPHSSKIYQPKRRLTNAWCALY